MKGAHSVYECFYHLVFCPKYRRAIAPELRNAIETEFKKTAYLCRFDIVEMTVAEDHVHLLLTIPPYLSVSRVVQLLKQWSSRNCGLYWQTGYFVTTVADDRILTKIRNYILTQRPQPSIIYDNETTGERE